MKCDEVCEKLDRYLGSELSEIEEYNMKKHISNCLSCKYEYEEMKELFSILSNHETIMMPVDFTDNVLDEIYVYEKDKNIKEVFVIKGIASVLAAGILTSFFSFVEYKPVSLFAQIYKGSEKINRIVVEPVGKLSEEIKDIANSF